MTEERVIMFAGLPASGKSTAAKEYQDQGFVRLNRDQAGGKVEDLLWPMEQSLQAGQKVLLDNTFITAERRKPFIELAKKHSAKIGAVAFDTTVEDAQINALHRMWDRYGRLFLSGEELKSHKMASEDPNMFAIGVFFKFSKSWNGDTKKGVLAGKLTEKSAKAEGFDSFRSIPFQRRHANGIKALILDYDGTLRDDATLHGGTQPYPTDPSQVKVLPNRSRVLQTYLNKGYKLFGVSNQSGIAKGAVTHEQVRACIDETHRQLGISTTETVYCPHPAGAASCYCRKPQSGLGVYLIRKYGIDPRESIFVGDYATDESFARRLGFQYVDEKDFFK